MLTLAKSLIVALLVAIVGTVLIESKHLVPHDDGVRPVWVGHCGGVDYRWHTDPRTTMSGRDCVVERVEN